MQLHAVLSKRRNTITPRPQWEIIRGNSNMAEKEHFIYGNEQKKSNTQARSSQIGTSKNNKQAKNMSLDHNQFLGIHITVYLL